MNGGGRRRRREDLPIRAEINVTSLVDVAFTLLVIFMITAPMLQGGVEVQVPEADVPPLTAKDEPITVTIDREGRVFLGRTEVVAGELSSSLPQLLRAADAEMIYIKGDSVAHYGRVLEVIATVAQVPGIKYGLVAEPRPRRPGER
jgi:biopolymer transport protein ExbD